MKLDLNPELDLILERMTDIPASDIWEAWTNPELIKEWFCPRPWKTTACTIDLRPGGVFATTMKGPEGEEFSGAGCILEVVPNKRFVWTDALAPDYRPSAKPFFTGIIMMEELNGKTKYTAIARHGSPETMKQHQEMGFEQGWGIAFDQLVELMKSRHSK